MISVTQPGARARYRSRSRVTALITSPIGASKRHPAVSPLVMLGGAPGRSEAARPDTVELTPTTSDAPQFFDVAKYAGSLLKDTQELSARPGADEQAVT